MSQSLINNVSKLKSLVLSGTIGATGPIGPQGERGNALDVNYFGELSNIKVTEIQSDTTITETNAFIIVVQSDTRTSNLNGIDTEGNLTDLANHIIIYNGTNWHDHGVFTGIAGNQGVQGVKGVKGDTGDTGIGIQGPQGQQGVAGPQGDLGPQGTQGNQGNVGSRGESFQVDDFGDLTNVKVADIINNSGASAIDFYVFVVKVDGSILSPQTRTVALNGIDTSSNLVDLSRCTIMYDGTNWSNYGEFTGVKGDTGPTGPQGDVGGVASFQLTTNGNHVHTVQLSELEVNNLISGSVSQYNKTSSNVSSHTHDIVITYVDNEFVLTIDSNHGHSYLMINRGPTGLQGTQGIQGVTGPRGHQGNQGAKGDTGNIGPQGPMGAEGIQGVQGPPGPAGAVGQQGTQGIQGGQGIQGQQGDQGVKGDTGDTGPTGVAGPRGIQGLKGDAGDIGPAGPAGIQGPQGIQGIEGAKGDQGGQGIQGTQGLQGDKGDKGDTGQSLDINFSGDIDNTKITTIVGDSSITEANAYLVLVSNDNRTNHLTGIDTAGNLVDLGSHVIMYNGITWADIGSITGVKGEEGEVGPTGPQGLQGLQGDVGPQGIQGEQGTIGPQGEVGPAGPQGLQGNAGDIGPTGQQGAQGVQGPIGLTGPTGAQGAQGVKGEQGLQGIEGTQGPQGNEGGRGPTGLQGIQGVQGYTGPVGPTGPTGPLGQLGPTGVTGPIGPRGEGLKIDLQNDINNIVVNNIQAISGLSEINPYIVLVSIDNRTQGLFGIDTTGSLLNLSSKLISYNGTKWTNLGNLTGVKGDTGDQGDQGIQGDQGPIGDTGPQGERGEKGEVFQIDAYGALDDTKVTQILSAGANQSDVYVFSVSTDTRTVGLPGIDTAGNLTDLSTHAIMYNGVSWTDYGQFKGDLGPVGPQGDQGIQGPRGESFQVDAFGELNDARVDTIVATSASATDFYVFVVTTDTRTSTKNLSGIDTAGNLTSLDKNVIMYDGTTWSNYGQFTGLKGDKGDQGDVGPEGPQGNQGDQGVPGNQGLQGTAGGIEHSLNIQNVGGNKYVWNNNTADPQQVITLVRGFTYYISIDVAGHPFHIQTSGNGYNASNNYALHSSYEANALRHSGGDVNTNAQGKIDGIVTFQVPHLAPDTLYYQCEYHSGMYGEFQVTDGKGDQGIQGIQGPQGIIGPTGPSVWTETATELSTVKNVHVANDKEIVILDSGGNATNATVMKNDGSNEFTLKQGSTTHLTMNSSGATFVGDVTGQVSSIVNHSVTDLADVTDAGSGAIITGAERTKITNATNNATASTLVERDGSGDFSANIITASNVISTVNGIDISALNTTLSGLDSAAVKKTGDQTIAGVKTFSDNVALNGGLTIAGGTTAVNSTVLTVQDINVELGVGAANDAAVDGGGIILKGETDNDKKITWDNANTAWRSNKNFRVSGSGHFTSNLTSDGTITANADDPSAKTELYSEGVRFYRGGSHLKPNSTHTQDLYIGQFYSSAKWEDILCTSKTFRVYTGGDASTDATEKFRIDNDGNVGIGTDNPDFKLEVAGTDHTILGIRSGNNDTHKNAEIRLLEGSDDYGFSLQYHGSDTNNFKIMSRIDGVVTTALTINRNDCNVGIGTTAPNKKCHVDGELLVTGEEDSYQNERKQLIFGRANRGLSFDRHHYISSRLDSSSSPDGNYLKFNIDTGSGTGGSSFAETMTLTGAGRVGIGTTNPTANLHVNGNMKIDGYSVPIFQAYNSANVNNATVTFSGLEITVADDGTWSDYYEFVTLEPNVGYTFEYQYYSAGTTNAANGKTFVVPGHTYSESKSGSLLTITSGEQDTWKSKLNNTFTSPSDGKVGIYLHSEGSYTAKFRNLRLYQTAKSSELALEVSSNANPQYLIKTTSTSGIDANIEIRGARSENTTEDVTSITLSNYDDSSGTPTTHILGKISGRVSDHTANVGDLILQSSDDGSTLSDVITLIGKARNDSSSQPLPKRSIAFNVGRLATERVFFENNVNDNQDGAGLTLRTEENPVSGCIFSVRSSGQAPRLWVGQEQTNCGVNDFYFGHSSTSSVTEVYDTSIFESVLKNDGSVGIGTDNPTAKLHINTNEISESPLKINIKGDFVNKIYFEHTGTNKQLGFYWVKIYYSLNGVDTIIPISDLSIDDSNTTYPPSPSSYDDRVPVNIFTYDTSNQYTSGGAANPMLTILLAKPYIISKIETYQQTNRYPTFVRLSLDDVQVEQINVQQTTYPTITPTNSSSNNILTINDTGNVGIGTNDPSRTLDLSTTGQITFGDDVAQDSTSGIYWDDSESYGIYRGSGEWTGNYQQLKIKFVTGIILDPGSGSYGKSHVGVVGGMSIGDTYYTTKYDNGMIVQGNVGIGTNDPGANLEIYGDTAKLQIRDASSSKNPGIELIRDSGDFGSNTSSDWRINNNGGKLRFHTAGTHADAVTDDVMVLSYTGNVGIGTNNPSRTLDLSTTGQITFGDDVAQDSTSGIYWDDSERYGIYRTSGAWTDNTFQQLKIKFVTGIILDPGSGDWEKSHVGVVGGMSIGDTYYTTKYDNGMIVQGNVGIGTTTPDYLLDIQRSGQDNYIRIQGGSNSANYSGIFLTEHDNTYGWMIRNHGADKLYFSTSIADGTISDKITIDRDGNVGIGTNDPQSQLSLHKEFTASGIYNASGISFTTNNENKQWGCGYIGGYIRANDATISGYPGGLVFKTKVPDSTADFTYVDRMVIDSNGNVGIGTDNPKTNLHLNLDVFDNNSTFMVTNIKPASIAVQVDLILNEGHDKSTWRVPAPGNGGNTRALYHMWHGDDDSSSANYYKMVKTGTATFTGQHKNVVENKVTNDCHESEGLIVSSIGDKYISYTENGEIMDNYIHINECLPKVKITNKSKDKGVYGVITSSTNQSNVDGEEDDDILENNSKISSTLFGRLRINSVGEGGIWVCNINGNLENGDYITSSTVTGYGQLQDDDLLHNYTVAKITCHCDFDNLPDWIQTRHINENGEIQDSPSTYIAAFVGCTYHCG